MADDGRKANQPDGGASGRARRRHPRAKLSILVQYRFDTLHDFLGEYAEDISLGGMFIRTDEPRPVGSMIYLQFALKDGSRLIEGLGRVVHVTPPGSSDSERPAGMGIEFVNFDPESEAFLQDLVAGLLEDPEAPEPGAAEATAPADDEPR
jgi:molecular chaperone DnaK